MEIAERNARQLFTAALREAAPGEAVRRQTAALRNRFRAGGFQRLIVAGFGKAAPAMAQPLAEALDDLVESGVIITKYGHILTPLPAKIRAFEAGHPVPDANGLEATTELCRLVTAAGADTLIVTLISGGGSALLVAPQQGLTLADKQQTTGLLLRAGADISELNTVRKHLSRVKGGLLAASAFPATIVALILSDVIGDRLDVIASGPTAADPTTFSDALAILARYRLEHEVPQSVIDLLRRGAAGDIPDTPKAGSPLLARVEHLIVGSNRQALAAAARAAGDLGYTVQIVADAQTGEAREVGRQLARRVVQELQRKERGQRLCLLMGGETTVTVRGRGQGGRNMELALAFALELEGVAGVTLLSAGTDGTDGPTDAAGAVVDATTVPRARTMGLDPQLFLDDNDSYRFFQLCGGLIKTGATGTNVMDLQIAVLE